MTLVGHQDSQEVFYKNNLVFLALKTERLLQGMIIYVIKMKHEDTF